MGEILQSDWYSPTRLRSSPTAKFDFPGDRFIPNRSLMDLDQAHSLLTNRTKPLHNSDFNELYRQKLEDKLTLNSEGKPFRMLVFRGSPKSSRRPTRCVDEMRRRDDEAEELENNMKQYQLRSFPQKADRILDAPNIINDFYMNILDWGKNNTLAVALGSVLYLWNPDSGNVHKLFEVDENDCPTSVAWSKDAKTLAVGYFSSKLQLWDAETSKLVRTLDDHTGRIATIAWKSHIFLTSGGQDKSILNHDVRARSNLTSSLMAHTEEVCRLKWSDNKLASGGNENLIYIWDSFKMCSSSKFLYRFNEHCGAVKALAWCPYQHDVLASGGGTTDGCIKIWSTQKGICINSIETKSQICGLEWNRHHKEIVSGHGFSANITGLSNRLCLWGYPSMAKLGDSPPQDSRVLHLSQSPDGLTVVSAGADQTLRLWKVFGPPAADNSRLSNLDSILSLKTSPIR